MHVHTPRPIRCPVASPRHWIRQLKRMLESPDVTDTAFLAADVVLEFVCSTYHPWSRTGVWTEKSCERMLKAWHATMDAIPEPCMFHGPRGESIRDQLVAIMHKIHTCIVAVRSPQRLSGY